MKFIKTIINQRLINKETQQYEVIQVEGYLCGDKGLNIAKGYKCWTVSHQRSGCQVFDLPLPFKQAKQAVELLSEIMNWTLHEDEVLKQATVSSDNSALIRRIRFVTTETAKQVLEEVETELNARKPEKLPWKI